MTCSGNSIRRFASIGMYAWVVPARYPTVSLYPIVES